MSTVTIDNLQTGVPSGGFAGPSTSRFAVPSSAATALPNDNLDLGGPAAGAANPNQVGIEDTSNEIPIPAWIAGSGLIPVPLEKNEPDPVPACFFEPIGFCQGDILLNGFCIFHTEYLLNIKLDYAATYSYDIGRNKYAFTKRLRKLTNIPRPFSQTLSPVFPIAELYSSLPRIEDIHLTVLLENCRARSRKEYEELIAAHVKFIYTVFNAFSNTTKTSVHDFDASIIINFNNWKKFITINLLEKYPCQLRLLIEESGSLRYLNINKCSVITQALVRCFELPYAILPTGQVLGGIPAYSAAFHRHLCLDDSKASNGTRYADGVQARGDPATIALTRIDPSERAMSVVMRGYRPFSEICTSVTLNLRDFLSNVRPIEMPA